MISNIPILIVLLIIASVFADYVRSQNSYDKITSKRTKQSMSDVYQKFFSNTLIPEPEFQEIWLRIAESFGVCHSFMHPNDRIGKEIKWCWPFGFDYTLAFTHCLMSELNACNISTNDREEFIEKIEAANSLMDAVCIISDMRGSARSNTKTD